MIDLVVTADDVGLASGMTRGALAAHDQGIVTACSVAANGEDLDQAVRELRARPALAVGVHWILTGERPLSPPPEIPSLVDRRGHLLPSFRAFALRYAAGNVDLAEVELELGRQIERLLELGLPVVHANGHQHLHLLPRIAPVVAALAERHAIRWLRVVEEPAPGWSVPRGLEMRLLNLCGVRARRVLAGRFTLPDQTLGIRSAGHLDGRRLENALRSADPKSRTVELVCHPGLDEAALARRYRWGYSWESETATLSAPSARAAVDRLGFRLAAPGAALAMKPTE